CHVVLQRRRAPRPPLFPYTPLFRSWGIDSSRSAVTMVTCRRCCGTSAATNSARPVTLAVKAMLPSNSRSSLTDRLLQTLGLIRRHASANARVGPQQVTTNAQQVMQVIEQRCRLPAIQLPVAQLLPQVALESSGEEVLLVLLGRQLPGLRTDVTRHLTTSGKLPQRQPALLP